MSAKITSFDMVNVAPCTALQRKPCISRLEFYIQHIGAKTSRFVLQRVVGVCVCAPSTTLQLLHDSIMGGLSVDEGYGLVSLHGLASCLEDLQ